MILAYEAIAWDEIVWLYVILGYTSLDSGCASKITQMISEFGFLRIHCLNTREEKPWQQRSVQVTAQSQAHSIQNAHLTATSWPMFNDFLESCARKQTEEAINADEPLALKLVRNGAIVRTSCGSMLKRSHAWNNSGNETRLDCGDAGGGGGTSRLQTKSKVWINAFSCTLTVWDSV